MSLCRTCCFSNKSTVVLLLSVPFIWRLGANIWFRLRYIYSTWLYKNNHGLTHLVLILSVVCLNYTVVGMAIPRGRSLLRHEAAVIRTTIYFSCPIFQWVTETWPKYNVSFRCNSLTLEQNGWPFCRQQFYAHRYKWKYLNLQWNTIEMCYGGFH